MRRWPWYSPPVIATRRSLTSSTGSPATSEAVWPSGPRPRWTRSKRSGRVASYSRAALPRSRWVTGIGRSAAWWSIESPRTMWVRLRAGSPGAATRSSTWNSSVFSHGISSSSPRIASIAQGERPPLIASANVARSTTAWSPAAAISSAARREAAFSSPATSSSISTSARLLVVAAELLAHRREDLVAEVAEAARVEALVQGGGEDRRRHALVDRRDRRPATLAGVRDAAGELLQVAGFLQRRRGQVEQPGADHAAPAPDLGDLGQVEVVLVVLGVVERRRLGVGLALDLAGVGVLEDVEALGVGGHDAVLDPVVDHLHEVAGAVGAAVQVAVLRGRELPVAPRRALGRVDTRREAGEDRVEPLHRPVGAADHQAVAALEPEDAAAGAAVDVVDPPLSHLFGAADVVPVVGVAAVDDRVAGLQHRGDRVDRLLGDLPGRDHDPDRARGTQLRSHLLQRGGALGSLARQLRDRIGVDVVGDDLVAVAHQAPRHVGSHSAEADDSEFHESSAVGVDGR